MKRLKLMLAGVGLFLGAGGQLRADLIVNGGFETGNFTGWNTNGAPSLVVEHDGHLGIPTHSGNYYANFGTSGEFGVISQTVADTSGASYTLQMWLWSDGGGGSGTVKDEFQIA
jgi:hypothetical protein